MSTDVSILWYPKGTFGYSHVKLCVGDKVYRTGSGYVVKQEETIKDLKDKALQKDKKGFYQYHLKLDSTQIKNLTETLKKIEPSNGSDAYLHRQEPSFKKYPTCVKGVCNLLDGAGFHIPKFFTIVPFITAIYLACSSYFNKSEVSSAEYVGKNRLKDITTINLVTEALASPFIIPFFLAFF